MTSVVFGLDLYGSTDFNFSSDTDGVFIDEVKIADFDLLLDFSTRDDDDASIVFVVTAVGESSAAIDEDRLTCLE